MLEDDKQVSVEMKRLLSEEGKRQDQREKLLYDYILVSEGASPEDKVKQDNFLQLLRDTGLTVDSISCDGTDNSTIFYGIKAKDELLEKYKNLLKTSDACNSNTVSDASNQSKENDFYSSSTRIRLVHFIVTHAKKNGEPTSDVFNVFQDRFCLHEESGEELLKGKYGRWTTQFERETIKKIRTYFGEKIALYFLWLFWYTVLLIPPAIIGVIVFVYNFFTLSSSPLINEVCESEVIMCPLCDKICQVWRLSETCMYAKLDRLFDNNATVIFAMLMALWTTFFVEFWKKKRDTFASKWHMSEWSEDEDEVILEILSGAKKTFKNFSHSFIHNTLIMGCVAGMILLIIGLTNGLVLFRVMFGGYLAKHPSEHVSSNSNAAAMLFGAILHLIIIIIMSHVNRKVAFWLSRRRKERSTAEKNRSFTIKMFVFQFTTSFCSLFYVAFFLGRINGHPGDYVRLAGMFRLQECHPSGCLTDLFIQMFSVMVLSQIINNLLEYVKPKICHQLKCKKNGVKGPKHSSDAEKSKEFSVCKENYDLPNVNSRSLFDEYSEMVIQFSLMTIFIAAFPLAPLCALINNVIEVRLDSYKMVKLERRMVPEKTNNIGVWVEILEFVGNMAVIINGLVIGISSNFIDRLMYQYVFGPCGNNTVTDTHCMVGYINSTLSVASMNDPRVKFDPRQMITDDDFNATYCSYKDYRDKDFNPTPKLWLIWAARFAFVIIFEHFVLICKLIAAWFLPSTSSVSKKKRHDKKLTKIRDEFRKLSNDENQQKPGTV